MRSIEVKSVDFDEVLNGQLIVWSNFVDIGVVVSKTMYECEIMWFREPEVPGVTEWFGRSWFEEEEHNITTLAGDHEYPSFS